MAVPVIGGAEVVELWRDRPVRSHVGERELGELVALIDQALGVTEREAYTAGRLDGVRRAMSLVARVVELAPWGTGDPLAIRDDLRRALAPDAEVPQ